MTAQLLRGAPLLALALLLLLAPASASDDAFEFWLKPSVSVGLDGNTGVEIETAQRLRDAGDGRPAPLVGIELSF